MIRESIRKFSGFPVWIIPSLLLFVLTIAIGFNGLYGQDSFEYLRYSRAIHEYFKEGILPGQFLWPLMYPMTGSLLSFLLPDILSLQLISIVCYGATFFYLQKIFTRLYPEKQEEMKIYLLLFFCLSPFIMRYSVTVMSEPMTLFFITAFYYYWLAFTESRKHKYFLALIFFGCTAINTRYPSLVIILIPLLHALYLFIRNFRVGFFLSSCLIAGLVILPAFLLRVYEPGSIFSQPDFAHWSMGNYIKRSFITADGEHSYLLPNICYVFTDLVHPGYIFPGLVFLFFFIKHRMERAFMKVILFVVLVYAFFLAGLSFQNDRVLILTFPLVLILFARPFLALKEKIGKLIHPNPSLGFQESSLFISRRGSQINRRVMQKIENVCLYFARLCVKLCETLRKTFIFHFFGQHFKKLVIISLILIQIVLFYRAFNPIYRNNRITKTISEEMLKYPGKKIYTFNIDMALKGYGVKNEMVSLWSNKIDVFEPNALVLFNFADSRKQWKGMNPMINWETLSRDHHLKLLENFPEGWNLYEITD